MSERHAVERPLVGVGAIVFDSGLSKVLLIKRGCEPGKGKWSVPGGMLEPGEALIDACARELKEETGLWAELNREPAIFLERLLRDSDGALTHHFLIVDFWGFAAGGELAAASDVDEAEWVALSDVSSRETTRGLSRAIERARALAMGHPPEAPLTAFISD